MLPACKNAPLQSCTSSVYILFVVGVVAFILHIATISRGRLLMAPITSKVSMIFFALMQTAEISALFHNLSPTTSHPPEIESNLEVAPIERDQKNGEAFLKDGVRQGTSLGPSLSDSGCQRCHGSPSQEFHSAITEKEMRIIRLEIVKAQILSKLNLTDVPKVNVSRELLPSLVQEGKIPGASLDSFVVRPKTLTPPSIFIANSRIHCPITILSPSSCFKFYLSGEEFEDDRKIEETTLWVWKIPNKGVNGVPHMMTVSQIWYDEINSTLDHELLISHLITNVTEGWISMNISWSYSSQITTWKSPFYVRISCTTCVASSQRESISSSSNHWPFLVVKSSGTKPQEVRRKRSTSECSNGYRGCCRDSLYINFSEIGWGDWILQPRGFTMYFCRGTCSYVTTDSVLRAGNTYTGMLRRLLLRPNISASLKADLAPCCSPGHKDPLSVLCRTGQGSSAIRVRVLQDMIVRSCSCYD